MKKGSTKLANNLSQIKCITHPNEEAKFKIRFIYGIAKTALLILLQGALSFMFFRHIKIPSVESIAVLLITSVATTFEILLEVVYRLPTLTAAVNIGLYEQLLNDFLLNE